MTRVDERASAVGRQQHGLATRGQLRRAGISDSGIRRRLSSGSWGEPLPGVVDLRTHRPSWHGRLQALLLAAGPRAWASHRTAAYLHGFLDVARPPGLDVLVPRGRHPRVGTVRLHTTVAIAKDEVTVHDGLACTSAARTLLDLAMIEADPVLERLALDLGRRSPRALEEVSGLLDRHARRPGRGRLRGILDRLPRDVSRLESPLEVHGVARLSAVGLLPPRLQYQVRDPWGVPVKRVDAAWPAARLVVEFDGAAYHDASAQRAEDAAVRDRLRELGWRVVVLRASDLVGPRFDAAAGEIREAVT